MDSLIFELQIVFYFQLFLSANVRHMKFTLKLRKELKILRCLSCTCFVSRGSDIYFHYLESLDQLLI